MLILKRARVPAAVLPPALAEPTSDPVEPTVLCDIAIDGPRITSVERAAGRPAGPGEADLSGHLVFPGFVDAHVHLDKTHTWSRAPNRSGTFAEALAVLGQDKARWTREDLLRRAGFALRCAWEHGTRALRTHVDTWLPWGEHNHAAMQELRAEWSGRIEIQTVPLTGIASYATDGEAIADLALRYGACALGAGRR